MLDGLKNKASHYVSQQLRYLQLNAVDKLSAVLGAISFGVILLVLFVPIFFFAGMSLAEAFSDILASRGLGYLAAAGSFLLLFLILFLLRKSVIKLFVNLYIDMLTSTVDDDEEELKA